jgi:hypothetical protein
MGHVMQTDGGAFDSAQIAIDIGDEVKVHNSLLDGLQADMLSAEGLLGGTVNRLSKVSVCVGVRIARGQSTEYMLCTDQLLPLVGVIRCSKPDL